MLDNARAAGVSVVLTETGRREEREGRLQDTAFTVVREAVTNSLRHTGHLRRITVSLDHDETGACTVTVRDDGDATTGPEDVGSGLRHLDELVRGCGGSLSSGPGAQGGWVALATIPAQGLPAQRRDVSGPREGGPRRCGR